MNITKPSGNTKIILMIVVVVLIIITTIGIVVYFANKTTSKTTTNNQATNIFKNIDLSFIRSFSGVKNKIKNTTKATKTITKISKTTKTITNINTVAPVTRILTSFDIVFNDDTKPKFTNNAEVKKFLQTANTSTEVKTYLELSKSNAVSDNKIISTHYQDDIEFISASYPVDFSRVLTVDRQISTILINDINSSLAGQIIAQVENNVYAAHGKNILIPAGAKLIGNYKPLAKIGQERLQINWQRIITPKGINIVIGADSVDAMGRSGLGGKIDSRYIDRYGLSLLISSINAAALLNIETTGDKAVFINTFGKEITDISAKVLEEQIQIKPIIRIAHGTRILINPTRDIFFRSVDGQVKIEPFNFQGIKNVRNN